METEAGVYVRFGDRGIGELEDARVSGSINVADVVVVMMKEERPGNDNGECGGVEIKLGSESTSEKEGRW